MGMQGSSSSDMEMNMGMGNNEIWSELLEADVLSTQYDVIAGDWPKAYDEIVLIVNRNNEIFDMVLYSLGLLDQNELEDMLKAAMKGEKYEGKNSGVTFSYDEILSTSFKLLLNTDYYVKENSLWIDKSEDAEYMKNMIENALELKVAGIIRPTERSMATSVNGSIGYTSALTDHVIKEIRDTDIAKEQLANKEINVFTGITFDVSNYVDSLTIEDVRAHIAELPVQEQAPLQAMLANMPEEQIVKLFAERILSENKATYEDNLSTLGIIDDPDRPSAIRLYPRGFDEKKELEALIAEYNTIHEDAENEEYVISYTDVVGFITSSLSDMINIVSYVLIAFVSISLVVSSIMIAIITYISVLERTKEIGILRSIGASKKDVTRVFNAETVIEGFVAGVIGILITLLLNIPINIIIHSLTDISGLSRLPLYGAVGLIIISVFLTVIAGLIPSRMAAKKDPVEALRSE
jgi:putative ABC transport system permease protein